MNKCIYIWRSEVFILAMVYRNEYANKHTFCSIPLRSIYLFLKHEHVLCERPFSLLHSLWTSDPSWQSGIQRNTGSCCLLQGRLDCLLWSGAVTRSFHCFSSLPGFWHNSQWISKAFVDLRRWEVREEDTLIFKTNYPSASNSTSSNL